MGVEEAAMPWSQTAAMDERVRFITLHQEGLYSMAELCERFGISRQAGYKWLGRFQEDGFEAVREHSRAPRSGPQRTPEAVAEVLREARRQHPSWGAGKLLDCLRPRRAELAFPVASTAGE